MKSEQVAQELAIATNDIIDCVNENLHRANLISETAPRFIRKAQQLQTHWRQKAEEKAGSIKKLTKLNWDTYWQYLVKRHSQCMTLKCLTNATEKIAPTLADSVLTGQLKSKVGQPTLLKPILNACNLTE